LHMLNRGNHTDRKKKGPSAQGEGVRTTEKRSSFCGDDGAQGATYVKKGKGDRRKKTAEKQRGCHDGEVPRGVRGSTRSSKTTFHHKLNHALEKEGRGTTGCDPKDL